MNEDIKIAEILKLCKPGIKLYSPAYGELYLDEVIDYGLAQKMPGIQTKAFLITVIENKSIDIYRKNKRRPTEAPEEEQEGLSFAMPTGAVASAIAKLPPRERNFIILKYAEGYTNKELSKMLGLTYSGVNSLDHRTKEKLRKLLKEEGIEV